MARKMSKDAYDYVVNTIRSNGSMSTDDAVDLVRPHYDFDPGAARERELRQYVGQLVRGQRDDQGVRTTFLEKTNSEIIDIDRCKDTAKLTAVAAQLRTQAKGVYRSYRKAAKRAKESVGQIGFDEVAFFRELAR